jgi:hypothetical protein
MLLWGYVVPSHPCRPPRRKRVKDGAPKSVLTSRVGHPPTPAHAAPLRRLWSRQICSALHASSPTATATRTKAARQACGPGCVQRQAAKGKISARLVDGESAHRVHLMLRAASQGHVLTVRRFFFRRSLCDLSYRTATEVTPQLPAGGDVSPSTRRRRRRWSSGCSLTPRIIHHAAKVIPRY